MATRGWESCEIPEPARPGRRRGSDELHRAELRCRLDLAAGELAAGRYGHGSLPERELQARCEKLLRQLQAHGLPLLWAHIPDVAVQHGSAGRQQAKRKGLPDLLVGLPSWGDGEGLVLGVELKAEAGRVTPEQAAWLAAFGRRGCVARSEGAVIDFLREWRVVG
jgi:hypothetical protein